ncbi:hypothetical protein FGO68_gene8801 [Halteria grandinella]|uniref:Uncharacterized protein n=1 Tax=Halteria grandinella TaxID=5974 RepID=A0A8J8NTR1_HALGN|nr:hypothetical protein FGO68_gene8801 [Halteria grandinella]
MHFDTINKLNMEGQRALQNQVTSDGAAIRRVQHELQRASVERFQETQYDEIRERQEQRRAMYEVERSQMPNSIRNQKSQSQLKIVNLQVKTKLESVQNIHESKGIEVKEKSLPNLQKQSIKQNPITSPQIDLSSWETNQNMESIRISQAPIDNKSVLIRALAHSVKPRLSVRTQHSPKKKKELVVDPVDISNLDLSSPRSQVLCKFQESNIAMLESIQHIEGRISEIQSKLSDDACNIKTFRHALNPDDSTLKSLNLEINQAMKLQKKIRQEIQKVRVRYDEITSGKAKPIESIPDNPKARKSVMTVIGKDYHTLKNELQAVRDECASLSKKKDTIVKLWTYQTDALDRQLEVNQWDEQIATLKEEIKEQRQKFKKLTKAKNSKREASQEHMNDVITSHYQKLQLKNAINEIKLVKGNQSPKAHTTAQIVPTLVRKGISNPVNEQIDYINQMIQVNCKHIRILEQRRTTNEQVYSQSMTTLTHHCIDIGTRMAQSENRLQQATEDNYLLKEEMEQTTEEYRESCRQFEEDQRILQQSYASISGIHKRYPSQQQFKSVMQQNLSIHPRGAAYPSNDQDIVQFSRNHQTEFPYEELIAKPIIVIT